MTREEAIETVRRCCPRISDSKCDFESAMRVLVPELRESEDERIRKWLLEQLKETRRNEAIPSSVSSVAKAIAWLEKQKEEEGYEAIPVESTLEYKLGFKAGKESEKQKEQKPAEEITDAEIEQAMDEVTKFKVFAADLAKTFGITYRRDIDWHNFCAGLLTYLKRVQPVEWSEEDLRHKSWILECLADGERKMPKYAEDFRAAYKWLKSLRPSWKPSEEQMEALEYVIRDYREDSCNATANYLQEILDHLKNM